MARTCMVFGDIVSMSKKTYSILTTFTRTISMKSLQLTELRWRAPQSCKRLVAFSAPTKLTSTCDTWSSLLTIWCEILLAQGKPMLINIIGNRRSTEDINLSIERDFLRILRLSSKLHMRQPLLSCQRQRYMAMLMTYRHHQEISYWVALF
jgi:hypothetical protein